MNSEKDFRQFQRPRTSYSGMGARNGPPMQSPFDSAIPFQSPGWPAYQDPWHFQRTDLPQHRRSNARNEESNTTSDSRVMISVRDADLLGRYYKKAFENLQQTNCRVLAKAYIKLVEPRKQVNYPYNGRKIVAGTPRQLDPNETKPPWWPSGVSHREPDHLPKSERIRLLIYILRDLRTSHGISARKLREADQPIRRQISPIERLEILDELYRVRHEEEKFLEGKTDTQGTVWISRSNLPKEAGQSHGERSRNSSPISVRNSAATTPRAAPEGLPVDSPHHRLAYGGDFSEISPRRQAAIPQAKPGRSTVPVPPSFDSPPVFMSPQDLKRKRESMHGFPLDSTSLATGAHYSSMSPVELQALPIRYYGDPYDYQQGGTITEPSTTGPLDEPIDYPYHFGY
ncbi:hypothetical protein N7474_006337 [Penicillium riverlandense]|uniref:uncharacterized protein n=1 Tax=Penicillium riverlandense TaxID=1903569 RepID=UPI002548FB2F|nr:uncharacterized protein N7474_006337 [Penicillium riverlandense]KAJ5814560.1 hypothetical protein N7474_006337 [Penicillium riverlandense]